jgi:ankyrin repeat protein
MDSLAKKLTRREVRTALGSLPKELDETYDQAMQRIQNQDEGQAALAHRVLYWISYSLRPLTVAELQHALAVEPGDDDLEEDGLHETELMVSVCAGLVTVDRESDQIRLVHYTTQSYLKRTRTARFPEARSTIAKTCLAYLLFRPFAERYCLRKAELYTRLRNYPFLRYAASHWGDHVRDELGNDVRELALEYLSNNISILSAIQATDKKRTGMSYLQWDPNNGSAPNITRLHVIALFGLVDLARHIMAESVDVNATTAPYDNRYGTDGVTPLHLAVEAGHAQMVHFLLCAGAKVTVRTGRYIDHNCDAETPLHIAARNGHQPVAQLLIEAGADCNGVPHEEQYPGRKLPLNLAAEHGHIGVARLLIEYGADISARDSLGHTALNCAARAGHMDLVELLITRGTDIFVRDRRGKTALDEAASAGHIKVVELLIARGINSSVRDAFGRTALHEAASAGHIKVVELLIAKGINSSVRDAFGRTALHEAAWPGTFPVRLVGASSAASAGHIKVVELLIAKGLDISTKSESGQTALHIAAGAGHAAIVRTLLESNADVLAEDLQGRTAVHEATRRGHENVVRILLERIGKANEAERWLATSRLRGAVDRADEDEVMSLLGMGAYPDDHDINADIPILHEAVVRENANVLQLLLANGANVNVRQKCGRTPLHWAACRGYDIGVQLLLEHGADIQAADLQGATPLHLAAGHGTASVVKKLLDNGAQMDAKDNDKQTVLSWVFHPELRCFHSHMLRKNDYLEGEMDEEREKIMRENEEQEAMKERLAVLDLLIEKGSDLGALLTRRPAIVSLTIRSCNGREMTVLALVRRLLEKGADVAAQTDDGRSALYTATIYGLPGVVQLLLEHGADVNQRNRRCAWVEYMYDGPKIYWYDWRGPYMDGVTALHEAARRGCLKIAHLLIDAGADVEAMDDGGITVLHEAAIHPSSKEAFDSEPTDIVDLLLAHGADINAHYGPKKATVLHCAAAQGNIAMACHLLQNGARTGATDADGKTALDLAAARGHEAMMFVLNRQNEA